jgi:phosphohistidine phosphatase
MQRRVTLLRHGHADDNPDDFARPLNATGRAAAARAGEALARVGWAPAYVLASSAPRALATAELAMKACGYRGEIRAERALYLASDGQCRAALRQAPPHAANVLLVGHNPGLTRLARDLCDYEGDLAPGQFASIELDLDAWSEL